MLYPQRNKYRDLIDLSGFWDFRFDFKDEGLDNGWMNGFEKAEPIAVPASWNDQFAENRDFLGPAWYQIEFSIPDNWKQNDVRLRFGSVNYLTDVFLNGEKIGSHEGGHLPFEFDITTRLIEGNNHLTVRVDGNLENYHLPPGKMRMNFPPTNFDFYPFCGIHRPVLLYTVPKNGIEDITVKTEISGTIGKVIVRIDLMNESTNQAFLRLSGNGNDVSCELAIDGSSIETILDVPDAQFWSPENPSLYDLCVDILQEGVKFDSYSLKIGIRTFEVRGDKIYLNGKPYYLKGFGRHEDFPVVGRGYLPALIIKDYSLMKWIGANSFRTSHYPYSEQMMDLADRLGFLVIDETPAVGLTFKNEVIEHHLELCKQYLRDLINRDKNHPSVIMWSLANEPIRSIKSKAFFKELYDLAKSIDHTRLITVVNMKGIIEGAFEFCEILCVNRYPGWYEHQGQIDEGIKNLSQNLDDVYEKYKKPVILSEFGADTIPGCHAPPPEMFSEEYQVEFIKKFIETVRAKDYIVGEHVWNLCDFKTSQGIMRVGGMNLKGVFTRDRRPKMAAHFLKETWHDSKK